MTPSRNADADSPSARKLSGMSEVDTPELRHWIIRQTEDGRAPEELLSDLIARGYPEEQAAELMTRAFESRISEVKSKKSRLRVETADSATVTVPQPLGSYWPTLVRAHDRDVRVLFSLQHPRVILFGDLLDAAECDELVMLARQHMTASNVIDMGSGGESRHEHRTSTGTAFGRGATPLILRIERRIEALLRWPLENGEALQILRYEVGQEYRPHYDYVDPTQPGAAPFLARGGQRVASLVMYLNTPTSGGATHFPDIGLEVAAVKGNAVFFSYDRPHPATKSLHGGMPVRQGEKWVATKWLRETAHQ